MANVFIVFQATDDSRMIVDAIKADNPHAVISDMPGLIKVDADRTLSIHRATVEEMVSRPFNLQELNVHLVTISGNLDEDDDVFKLSWNN